jgi:hypothetical protein
MNNHISIDVTNAKECAVPKEKFRIINFNVGNGKSIEDLVHNEPPYFHFQVLRPESKEQSDKAVEYFKEHKKIYVAWTGSTDLLLYLGCTESVYLKSKVVTDFDDEEFDNILAQAAHWFRFHKDEAPHISENVTKE